MEFLTPLFAALGVAAASIPVVLHMLRRAPTQNMPFSLVRFLKPSRPTMTKRSNIEHWPLMLLRILALVLIGLAFARPFVREVIPLDQQDSAVQSVTILIDSSASMRRDGIYDLVQAAIRETVDSLGDQDLLTIATFSNYSTTLITREKWQTATADERAAMVTTVIDRYEPDWLATNTGAALRIAADELAQESIEQFNVKDRRLVLITDFQRGSNLDELKTGNWPASVAVELKTVAPTKKGNVGVSFVKDRRADRTRVRVASAGDSVQQEFKLQPFGTDGTPVGESITVTVAPGQRRSLILPTADAAAGKAIVGVELLGDEHPFDNVIDLPETENPIVKVAHIGPSMFNDPESMRYYLQRVLAGNVERDINLVDLIKDDGVILPIPDDVKFVVVTDVVPDGLLDSVAAFLSRSGTLLVAPPSVDAVKSLQKFLPKHFDVQEADVDEYAMLGYIDYQHPLFSTFSDARFADFSSIRFWRHRNLVFSEEDRQEGDWSTVAKFDSGLPAIVEISVGDEGRLILFATGWHPNDSQLALSTRFPPLITRVLSLASPLQKDQVIQTVGDVIRPGELVSSKNWTMSLPNGSSQTSADVVTELGADADAGQSATVTLKEPGRYTVTGTTEDGEYSVSLIAGLSTAESRTEMLPVGQLQVLGIGVESIDDGQSEPDAAADETKAGQLNASDLEKKQKWWRWLLLAGLGCLVVESIWASMIERRQTAEAA
jgi:hypothetical protein